MRPKNINKKLEQVMADYAKSLPVKLRPLLQDVIITGGAIVSLLENTEVNDYDIYFSNIKSAKKLAEHYKKEVENNGQTAPIFEVAEKLNTINLKIHNVEGVYKNEEATEYSPIFISPTAITLSNKIQLIFKFVGSINFIHSNFDFEHIKHYWTPYLGVVFNQVGLLSLHTRTLRYARSSYPIAALFRIDKFQAKGFTITKTTKLRILMDILSLNITDPNILYDQLIGVHGDTFRHVLQHVRAKLEFQTNLSEVTKLDIIKTVLFKFDEF